jgi:hypothetical protein
MIDAATTVAAIVVRMRIAHGLVSLDARRRCRMCNTYSALLSANASNPAIELNSTTRPGFNPACRLDIAPKSVFTTTPARYFEGESIAIDWLVITLRRGAEIVRSYRYA